MGEMKEFYYVIETIGPEVESLMKKKDCTSQNSIGNILQVQGPAETSTHFQMQKKWG